MPESSKCDPLWIFIAHDGDTNCRKHLFAVAAKRYAGHIGRSSIDLAVERRPGQKPFFTKEKDVHFSISHSGEYWLCAFFSSSVGLDIQQKVDIENISEIAKRFFHSEEYSAISQNGTELFFPIWTAKESYVKYTGQGLNEDFGRFSCIQHGRIRKEICGVPIRHLSFASGYSLCVCAHELDQIRMEFIFSQ